jgi:uncharacterized protein YgbK (DUF1537 family)
VVIARPTSRPGLGVFIVADDLTGAADAAVCFRTARRRVRVTFPGGGAWDPGLGSDVVQVYDTESRALPAAAARRRVDAAMRPLAALRPPLRVFKKIDSTLRGQIGAEIEAALAALHRRIAVVAPAFPAHGRTVRGGRLFVRGIPLTQTSAARDPRTRVAADRVGAVLQASSALPVREVDLDTVRSPEALVRALGDRAEGDGAGTASPCFAVSDAETDLDLDAVAAAVADAREVLPCGAAGLARALAARWTAEPGAGAAAGGAGAASRPRCDTVLVVVGSADPLARAQLSALRRTLRVPVLTVDAARLAGPRTGAREIERGMAAIARSQDRIQALTLSADRVEAAGRPPLEAGLAAIAAAWCGSRAGPSGLVCTGGDTTLAVCRALGARALWPEGEVAPGVPWSALESPAPSPVLVSKAGGFGGPRVLVGAVEFLLGAAQPHRG